VTKTQIADAYHRPPLNPRFAGAIFFAIYSLLLIFFTKYTFLTLRDSALMPLLPSIVLALVIGAFVGACFGKVLAKKSTWIRPFFIGILLACFALLLVSVALISYYYFNETAFLMPLLQKKAYFFMYIQILLILSLAIGSWFIPLTGLVAIYFNKQFLPGLIATDLQRLETDNSTKSPKSDDN
jgi:hypothetical protein